MSKVVVIFPAKNEGKTIAQCVEIARQSKYQPEILVVDGFSNDNTKKEARSAGATVIEQSAGIFPAKGRAMKDGIKAAIKRKANVIVFVSPDSSLIFSNPFNSLMGRGTEDSISAT